MNTNPREERKIILNKGFLIQANELSSFWEKLGNVTKHRDIKLVTS